MNGVAAEHAHAVDAAARPRDRSFFEGQKRLGRDSDLSMAAQLMGRPLGGPHAIVLGLGSGFELRAVSHLAALPTRGAAPLATYPTTPRRARRLPPRAA